MTSPIKSIMIGKEEFNYPTSALSKDNLKLGDYVTVAYTDIPKKEELEDYVIVKIQEEMTTRSLAVKVSEFAKALQLTPQEFKDIQKQSKIKEHLNKIAEREVKTVDEVDTLDKVMTLVKNKLKTTEQEYELFEHAKEKFVAFKQDKDIKIVRIDEPVVLGQGTYGRILKIKNIKDNTFQVLKLAQSPEGEPSQVSIDSIKTEYEVLKKLYEEDPGESHLIGWEEKPHKLVTVPLTSDTPHKKQTFGILKTLYDTDLMDFLEGKSKLEDEQFDRRWQLDACYQLIIGIARLQKKGYWNPDIAVENTFVKKNGNFLQIDIADLSDVVIPDKLSAAERAKDYPIHPTLLLKVDEWKRRMLASNPKLFKKFVEGMNVFSLAAIMYCILKNDTQLPYAFAESESPNEPIWADAEDLQTLSTLSHDIDLDSELKDLLGKMLNVDSMQRPSASEVLNIFHQIIISRGLTDLAAKYEIHIAKLIDLESVAQSVKDGERPAAKRQRVE